MKEFLALRLKARQRRNTLIEVANAEYEATLLQIATLERGLLDKLPKPPRSVAAFVNSVMPKTGTFTYLDIKASLESLDPGRVWKERTIHGHLSKLRMRGIIRRLKRSTSTGYAVYTKAEHPVKVQPLDDMSLAQCIRTVLREPMTATEIMVAVTELGFRSTMSPRPLLRYIGALLRKGNFKKSCNKWMV
jgi:hypothetical protein